MSNKDNLLNTLLNIKFQPETNRDIQQVIKDISTKLDAQEINYNYRLQSGILTDFNESKTKFKNTLLELFPTLDADKFIKFVISSPLKSGQLDFKALFNLFNSIEGLAHNQSTSPLSDSGVTDQIPPSKEETIEKVSYHNFLLNTVFPIFVFLFTQFQQIESSEQLNRIENRLNEFIEQHEQCEVLDDEREIMIEIPIDASGGTRT